MTAPRPLLSEDLPTGGILAYVPKWLAPTDSERAAATLRAELSWEQRTISLFGRDILQPRLIAWAGEVAYRYSGQTLEPRAATPTVRTLFEQISEVAETPFNHVLVNRYRDGNDSMGFHSDDEAELGKNPTIASLSLGRPRRFVMKSKKQRHTRELDLGHGDLLILSGECQHRWRHGVPKQPKLLGERINLTFRFIRT